MCEAFKLFYFSIISNKLFPLYHLTNPTSNATALYLKHFLCRGSLIFLTLPLIFVSELFSRFCGKTIIIKVKIESCFPNRRCKNEHNNYDIYQMVSSARLRHIRSHIHNFDQKFRIQSSSGNPITIVIFVL